MVDLGRRTQITAVATQGRYGSSDWVTAYLLLFSDTGHNWIQHRQEDSLGAFQGNSNADFVVQYKLEQPVIARYLRLTPLDWNPTGRIGLRMEIYGCEYTSEVVSFDGSSSLIYRLNLSPSRMSTEVISLNFKTLKNSGTLLHAKGSREHSLNLVLEKGKLSFSGGQLLVSLGSLLDDQHWHHVELEKLNAHLNITVDKNTQQVHLPAELSHWYIHTVREKKSFHGCLENLLYSDLNLIDLARQGSPQATVVVRSSVM
uniref:Contactin associated protein like 3 n=1 Tax=Oryzias melastigma TaxID=30732 RepID=A0A3B3BW99_ORYME